MRVRWIVTVALLCLMLGLVACERAGAGNEELLGLGPTVSIISPPSGARIPTGREVEIQSSATDPSLVTRIELYINDDLIADDAAPADGQETFAVTQRWVPVEPGTAEVVVYAFNAQGQRSRPAAITLTVEGVALAPQQTATATTEQPPLPTVAPAEPTPVPATGIAGAVNASAGLNVRAGPDVNAERIGGLFLNDNVTGVGRNAAGDWIKIRFGENQIGWVFGQFVTWQGDTATLPVE